MFSRGEFEAARIFVAILSEHAAKKTFKAESVGFTFSATADLPSGETDKGVPVTTKDFIRAALKLLLGQMRNLEFLLDLPISELVAQLGIAVATEEPDDA